MHQPLLAIEGLNVSFRRDDTWSKVVHDLSLRIMPGESVGVVGESGCGKSVTAMSVLRLLPPESSITTGRILLEGQDLMALSERQMTRLRGQRVAMVFQEPMSALDPTFTIGSQISETVKVHFDVSRAAAKDRAIEMLHKVGIPAARQRYDNYPHQLSGGMRQRVMIAIALSCEPKLLIADEPTTALDNTVQAQILDLMIELTSRSNTALMLITHDLSVVSGICHRVLTMYGGALVEDGPTRSVLRRPFHPYTSGLVRAMPGRSAPKTPLTSIPGRLAASQDLIGCNFRERCAHREQRCATPQTMDGEGHLARCCRMQELALPGAGA